MNTVIAMSAFAAVAGATLLIWAVVATIEMGKLDDRIDALQQALFDLSRKLEDDGK